MQLETQLSTTIFHQIHRTYTCYTPGPALARLPLEAAECGAWCGEASPPSLLGPKSGRTSSPPVQGERPEPLGTPPYSHPSLLTPELQCDGCDRWRLQDDLSCFYLSTLGVVTMVEPQPQDLVPPSFLAVYDTEESDTRLWLFSALE